MGTGEESKEPGFRSLVLRFYSLLAIVQSLWAVWLLTHIPTEPDNALIWGFSFERLILLGIGLLPGAFAAGFLWRSWRDRHWLGRNVQRLRSYLNNKSTWGMAVLITVGVVTVGSYLLLLSAEITEPFTRAYFIRLLPIIWLFTGLGTQTLIALPLLRYGSNLGQLKPINRTTLLVTGLFGVFLLLAVGVGITRIGLVPETVGWYELGAPILETHALLAWVVGIAFLGLLHQIERGRAQSSWLNRILLPAWRLDVLIGLVIWIGTVWYWNNVPLPESWFVSPPRAPNYEHYPTSDALLYDSTGQSLLIGEGLKSLNSPFPVRPMYAAFLAVLNLIGENRYNSVASMQVAILALFPSFIYLLATLMHSRKAGVVAAFIIVLREGSATNLSDTITISSVKLLMSDLPTAAGVALFTLLLMLWYQDLVRRPLVPLIAGGVLGVFVLIRPETGILFPVLGLVVLLLNVRQARQWGQGMLLLSIGLILVLAPWIWRNWRVGGEVFLESPIGHFPLLAQRYSVNPAQAETLPQPGETADEFTTRVVEEAIDYVSDDPGRVGNFVLNHFVHSQIQTVLVLPASFRLFDSTIGYLGHQSLARYWEECCSSEGYIQRLAYWFRWEGDLLRQSAIPLLINLLLISVGLVVTWERDRLFTLLPVSAGLAYTGIHAVFRNSGGRYVLPVDWVGILFFGIGLTQISLWGISYFRDASLPGPLGRIGEDSRAVMKGIPPVQSGFWGSWRGGISVAIGFLVLGSLLPLSEQLFQQRYPEQRKAEILAYVTGDESGLLLDGEAKSKIRAFLEGPGQVLQGRALYPRFFGAGEGDHSGSGAAFVTRPYARVGFYLSGARDTFVVLPTQDEPDQFPNAADVVVLGCLTKSHLDALAIIFFDPDADTVDSMLFRSPETAFTCPVHPP